MLQALRKSTGSIVTKAFLLLIAMSFGVWGVGDMVTRQRDKAVISVGAEDIAASQFLHEYQRNVRYIQSRLGAAADPATLQSLGVVSSTERQLIDRSLYDQAAARLGMAVPEQLVIRQIQSNPVFRNSLGVFDPQRLQQALRTVGLSEEGFVAQSRRDIVREQLLSSVTVPAAVPRTLAERLFAYRQERRVAAALLVPHASVSEIAEPEEAAIEAFHKEHAADYTAPEYRRVTYIKLSPADLIDEVGVSEDDVREAYDQRLGDFVTVGRRDVQQMVLPDEAKARAAYDQLVEGRTFTTVAKEMAGQEAGDTDLGTVTRAELPSDFAETVFALPEGGISEPLKSGFGWHIFRVSNVVKDATKSFEDARGEVEHALKLDRAKEALFDFSNKIDDQLAGGASIEEAALNLNLKIHNVAAVDSNGYDPSGAPAADFQATPEMLKVAFDTEAGFDSPLTETSDGGYFVLRVDAIVAPAVRPLAQVREHVVEAWKAEQRRVKARAVANEIVERLKGGEPLEAVAKSRGYEVRTTAALTRNMAGAQSLLSPTLLAALFELKQGAVTVGESADHGAELVAQLREVRAAEPSAERAVFERITTEIGRSMQEERLAQYRAALARLYPVAVERAAIDRLIGSNGS